MVQIAVFLFQMLLEIMISLFRQAPMPLYRYWKIRSYFNISPSNVTVAFPAQPSPFTQNFCITPNGTHPDLEVSLLPLNSARPGFDVKYSIIYKNKGNTTQSGTVNLNFNDAVLDLVSASPTETTQNSKQYIMELCQFASV